MNRYFRLNVLLAIVMITFLGGCNNSDEPAVANVSLEIRAKTVNSGVDVTGRISGDFIVFHEVLVGLTELEFENEAEEEMEDNSGSGSNDEESEDEEIEFEGNFIVDLLNGTSTPDFGIANVIPGVYTEIEADLEPILSDGNTMFIRFTFIPDGGSEVMVEYSNNYLLEFEIERASGFEVTADFLNEILVIFDLDALFDGVDFNTAVADSDGVIRINQSMNKTLADQIEANFGNALLAGFDNDDDDEIDD